CIRACPNLLYHLRMLTIFKPATHRPALPADRIDPEYKRLRLQVFIGIFVGYAAYYFVRKNFSFAVKDLQDALGYSKAELGFAMSAISIAYGLSKFLMRSEERRVGTDV